MQINKKIALAFFRELEIKRSFVNEQSAAICLRTDGLMLRLRSEIGVRSWCWSVAQLSVKFAGLWSTVNSRSGTRTCWSSSRITAREIWRNGLHARSTSSLLATSDACLAVSQPLALIT